MMDKSSLSRAWCLIATGLVPVGLALGLAGCGGGGKPGGAADEALEVSLGWYNTDASWGGPGESQLTVKYPPGLCRVREHWPGMGADPFGNFEMMLTRAQIEELRAAVKKAIDGLQAGYPPPDPGVPGEPGADYYLHLACGRAEAGVSGPHSSHFIPEAVRPLYWSGPPGLLNKLYEETLEHPLAAIALSAASDREQYSSGEPIRLTLTVTSVGRDPVAFTPMSCREIVDGLITVTGQLADGERVLAETFPFGSSQQPEWEPFTAAARADLPLVRVLSPGDTYAFRLPPLDAPPVSGQLAISVKLRVSPRYHLSSLRNRAGAVVATGKWQDSLDVVVWP